MNINRENAHVNERIEATVRRLALISESVRAEGRYECSVLRPPEHMRAEYIELRDTASRLNKIPMVGRLLGRSIRRDLRNFPMIEDEFDHIVNLVTTEGKTAKLSNHLKGSTFTQTTFMGLIESTGFSAYNVTNTAAQITAVGGGSPANGWNEAQVSQLAARGTPSWGTASAGSLALSSALAHSIIATVTIKGAFMMIKSIAGVAAVSTVGSTAGGLYSCGSFSGGDKVLGNGDTLSVSYTATLT